MAEDQRGPLTVEAAAQATALRVDGLVKSFGGQRALDEVSFKLERGTVHALLGGNGSGKSTTIKILAGVYEADAGSIELGESRYDARSFTPQLAKAANLRFVHQQQSTFHELTIAENLAIGHGFETVGGRIRWRETYRHAGEVLARFGIDTDPRMQLGQVGVATQTMVTIARALQDIEEQDAGVLVLDEPTAALPPGEVKILFDTIRRCVRDGHTVLYITHRLEEVLELADRATILRDGRVVATIESTDFSHDSLVESIMGHSVVEELSSLPGGSGGETRVECEGLTGGPVRNVSFSVAAGEIVGVAGLLGSGRSTLLQLLSGNATREAGRVLIDGEPTRFNNPREATRAGVAYAPEDRLAAAAFLDLSVRANLGIVSMGEYVRGGLLRHRAERRDARRLLNDYMIKAPSSEVPLATLSGGNQQKTLLARWFRLNPRLLLLDEPTQGVDVGARAEIWRLVRSAVDAGAAALTVLSDFDELVKVCDRVIVLNKGSVVREFDSDGLTESILEHAVLSSGKATAT